MDGYMETWKHGYMDDRHRGWMDGCMVEYVHLNICVYDGNQNYLSSYTIIKTYVSVYVVVCGQALYVTSFIFLQVLSNSGAIAVYMW